MRGQRHALAALYPRGKTRYPFYRRLGGPQGRSGQVRKISPPPGFDPRTVQPVASHYTDNATRPTLQHKVACILTFWRSMGPRINPSVVCVWVRERESFCKGSTFILSKSLPWWGANKKENLIFNFKWHTLSKAVGIILNHGMCSWKT